MHRGFSDCSKEALGLALVFEAQIEFRTRALRI